MTTTIDVSASPIRILVVDDHAAVRIGLWELLKEQPDLNVVDAVAGAEVALSVAERGRIDVAVVDYQLGRHDGLWVSRKLKRLMPAPKVVIYSAYADGILAAAAVVAEADAVVSKASLGAEVCDAIRSVAEGQRLLPPVPRDVVEIMRARLDQREQAIYGMLLAGNATTVIADTLGLDFAELESSLWRMLRRLDVPPTDVFPARRATRRSS
jgi:DNA-binding NarL/FixJ family response regulator